MSEVNLDPEIIETMRNLGFTPDVASRLTAEDVAALRKAAEWKKAMGTADAKSIICDNCAFFSAPKSECRRYPPKILARSEGEAFSFEHVHDMTYFPIVRDDEWCGEWVPYVAR